MTRAALLAVLLLGGPAAAQTSGSLDTSVAGGATNLLLGAINFMRKEGHERACMSGMRAFLNDYTPEQKDDPRSRAGSVNTFRYYFYSPDKPHKVSLEIRQPIGGGPYPPIGRYNEYDPHYVGEGKTSVDGPIEKSDVRDTCISEMAVDTDKAMAVAAANGLPLGTITEYRADLVRAAGPDEPDWKDKALRGKTFWLVAIAEPKMKTVREYIVDAVTGKFIKSRSVRNPLNY